MRSFVEAYGCTIDSGESREMVDMLTFDGLQVVDSDLESVSCAGQSIASATPIHRTGKVDGAR